MSDWKDKLKELKKEMAGTKKKKPKIEITTEKRISKRLIRRRKELI